MAAAAALDGVAAACATGLVVAAVAAALEHLAGSGDGHEHPGRTPER